MPRNRLISQTEALYVGPTPSTGQHFNQFGSEAVYTGTNRVKQLFRIQSFNWNSDIPRISVQQFGQLDPVDRPFVATPTVPITFNYLLSNFVNEKNLGFDVNSNCSCISGILTKVSDDKNYFLKVLPEGVDANSDTSRTAGNTIGFGNGFITSYAMKAAVGGIPDVTIGVDCLNWSIENGTSGNNIPAIDPINGNEIYYFNYVLPYTSGNAGTGNAALSILRPGDVTVSIREAGTTTTYSEAGISITDAKIQSCDLSFNLSRSAIEKLGSRYAVSREINFPVEVRVGVSAIAGDLSTGSLSDILCDDTSYDIYLTLKKTACSGSSSTICEYLVKNVKLDSLNMSNGLNTNATADLSFSTLMAGSNNQTAGLQMSGIY